jgi:dihydrofolate synthase / folylpolyglutamate synthase
LTPAWQRRRAVGVSGRPSWSSADAERHLHSLELFGMRFGLDRMRRLMTVLDSPQRTFHSIHVVGTNGKSSTTRMIAAILERHGVRTGAYLSPHLISYAERVQVSERDVDGEDFGAAVERAAWAAEHVNHTLAEDDHVTQFELLTAAAFWELARRGVEVAVIEAGLGGRFDATNVIDAGVCALTNVGLEHTRWLGPTVRDIAGEKLAVVPPRATLVLGSGLQPEVLELARSVAERQGARLASARAGVWAELAVRGEFQQRNFALARAVAESYLTALGREPSAQAMREAASHVMVPGRFEVIGTAPLTIFDGAHNCDAAVALRQALSLDASERSLGLVFGVLEDKDAVGMLRTLLPLCERAWFTAPPSSRALPPATLQSLAGQLGFEDVCCEPQPGRALRAASAWATQQRGQERASARAAATDRQRRRMVVATGSVYLVGELMRQLRGAPAHVEAS